MFLKKIISPVLVVLCCLQLSAQQQWRFISYNVSNGLSQNSVHCIFQDRDGLLWLGTQDGLNSFDGRNFKTYKHDTSDTTTISDQFVLSINEDATGYLWIGTRSGLNKLNKRTGKFTRYYLTAAEKDTLYRNYPTIVKNNEDELYIHHYSFPSIIDRSGKLVPVDTSIRQLRGPVFDKQGRLWGTNAIAGVFSADKKDNYRPVKQNEIIKEFDKNHTPARHIMDNNNVLWLYTEETSSKIIFYDTQKNNWKEEQIVLASTINQISMLKNGDAWVSTFNGIYIIHDYKISQIIKYTGALKSLPPGSILCSFEDNQGNAWIGTASSGFAFYNPSFRNFNLYSTGSTEDAVTSFADMKNTRWIGAASGLYKMKNSGVNYSLTGSYFQGKKITGLTADKSGKLWVAVQKQGLYVLNENGTVLRSWTGSDSLLQTQNVLYLFCDSRNRIFVCAETGYFVFNSTTDKWQPFYQSKKKSSPSGWYTLHAFEDSKKNIWLSKHIGLDKLNENLDLDFSLESKSTGSVLGRTIITSTAEDRSGAIWIATLSNGIFKYENKGLKHYSISEGLNSNVIYGIICDSKGRLWATTTSGINVFEPEENRFYNLNSKDGLPADDYVLGALFKNDKGKILAGSSKGLIEIDADNIILKSQKAEAQISDIKLNGESVETSGNRFTVKPGYKTLGFEFSVRQALQPRNIIYQYRMAGSGDKWNTLQSSNPQITYSNLPFKKLTMQVRAAYSFNELNDAPVDEFTVIIQPAIWQTLWFKILAALLLTGLITFLIQQYNKIKFRRQLQAMQLQKELQQERSRISRDLHDNIGAYTSALIAGINQLKNENGNKEENITELNDYASNIMGYLRETIWVLNNQHLTFTAFTDRFKNYASRITKNYPELSLHFYEQIENEKELTPQISLNLFRIMQEALQNACKHADASAIEISFSCNHKIELSVTDNGKGIGDEKRDDSYGMANMQERAAEIGFSFTIRSGNGTGTKMLLAEK